MWNRPVGIAAWALSALLLPASLSADGMYIPPKSAAALSLEDISSPDQHVILVDRGSTQEMVVRVRVTGAPKDFAWVLPLPSAPTETPVEFEEGDNLFSYLYAGSGPRWVDTSDDFFGGCSGDSTDEGVGVKGGDMGSSVTLLGSAIVGELQIDTLSAAKASELADWLALNGYQVPAQFAALAQPYIEEKWVFLAMKVATPWEEEDLALQVLHLKWKGSEPVFPMRMTSGNAATGGTVVNLMVFSDHRAEVATMATRFAGTYPDDHDWVSYEWYDVSTPDPADPTGAFLASVEGMWWTRMDGTFAADQMTADLKPAPSAADAKYRETKLYAVNDRQGSSPERPLAALFALTLTVWAVLAGLRVAGTPRARVTRT